MIDMEPWTRQLLSAIVSQLCKTIGWHSISTNCLQILVDVLHRYLKQLSLTVHDYSEHYNHTLPGLEELSLALNDMGINVDDLKEYCDFVAPITIKKVPKYPLEKKSNLNFLKPGSREVVTRPVHIHEYLPAMYPEMSEDYSVALPSQDSCSIENSLPNLSNVAPSCSMADTLNRPRDEEMPMAKPIQRLISEEVGRPLRELSCIMMTTSGFLSPATEGKAPEARVPKPLSNHSLNVSSNAAATSQLSTSPAPSEVKLEKSEHKKHSKLKSSDHRKHREDIRHNGHNVADESKAKHASVQEISTLKASHQSNESQELVQPAKPGKAKMPAPSGPVEPKVVLPKVKPAKVEKVLSPAEKPKKPVKKLPTEPNKSKLNIFKRFTKVKEDRVDSTEPLPKKVQVEECVKTAVKRVREKVDPNMRSISGAPEQPLQSTSTEPELDVPSPAASTKEKKCKKKLKTKDPKPSTKRAKQSTPPASVESTNQPAEPELPPYSFFTQLQNSPDLMPPLLASNLLIPRFTTFANFSKMADPSRPHPEMPNLPLPPATLMQLPSADLHHEIAPLAPSKKSAPVDEEMENSVAATLSDKKLKKKVKKGKKEKEKKRREKKERLKERLEKKNLKKLQSKKERLKKKRKLAAAKSKEECQQPVEDPSVPKIKLKLGGNSPQLSPNVSGLLSPKIVIKPVLMPIEEPGAATGEAAGAQQHSDGQGVSPELAKAKRVGRPPKLRGSASKNVSSSLATDVSASSSAAGHIDDKSEPIAPITLAKSAGSEKSAKMKTKPKEKTKGKKSKVVAEATKSKPVGFYYDASGKQVWVCPACGGQDVGTSMIGCDGGCDAWYHWECVGIKSPPGAANWYCKSCVSS